MKIGIIEFLSRMGKPLGSKLGNPKFKNELVKVFVGFIEVEMARNNNEEASGIFKTVLIFGSKLSPDFAERVLESAPIFAALVAKMAVDEMMSKLDIEEEEARELQKLAEEYAGRPKRVQPI